MLRKIVVEEVASQNSLRTGGLMGCVLKMVGLPLLLLQVACVSKEVCGAYYEVGVTYFVKAYDFQVVKRETLQSGLDYWRVLGYDFRLWSDGDDLAYQATMEPMSSWYEEQGYAGLAAAAPGQILLVDKDWLGPSIVAHEVGHLLGVPHQDFGDCNVMAESACYRDELSEFDVVAWTRRMSWCPDPIPTPVR